MPSLSLPDQLIWFAHCPKAGGTSVEQFMVARWGDAVGHLQWGWDLWWKNGGWRVANPPNSPQHLTWADARGALPRGPDRVFALVRDPVARMTSEYRWQRKGRRGTKLGKMLARLPFPAWLRLMIALAEHHPHAFDNHLRPQSDFVPREARVFRLEDGLEPVFLWLSTVTETAAPVTIPHAIPTGVAAPVGAAETALIVRAFGEDYARFGYARPEVSVPRAGVLDLLARMLAPALAAIDRRGAL